MQKKYDVIVVGAGPAGSMAARYAAQQGVSVLMLEKDRDVGYPVRCGEAISKTGIEEFIEVDSKFIATTINNFSFVSPDGTEIKIPLEEAGYILERRIFDYELAKTAANEGAEILTRAYVNGLLFDGNKVSGVKYEYKGEQHEVEAKVVVAADGVESRVGRWAGLKTVVDFRDMESAIQITAGNIPVEQDTCYFYFGEDYAPQGYFWIFPKGNRSANIGLGVSGKVGKKKSAMQFLNNFMETNYPDAPVMTQVAGGVPCVITLDKISAPGIILVGDAARQVNPLSGGGIASGMIGGKIGGNIVGKAVKENNLDKILEYDQAWRNRLGKRHEMFDRLKNGIYNFSDEKFNSIARSVSEIPVRERSIGKVFKKALWNKPSLLVDVARAFF
jgi:digeranylgeranylglycerophospholipid reductase